MDNIALPEETLKFPFRFLLRWTWPEHIEKLIRRTLWLWLSQAGEPAHKESEEFEQLGGYVCWMIAVHPQTPPAVLDLLAQQNSTAFLERIAENPNAWPTTLTRLSKHSSARVRAAVAENHMAPSSAIANLAHDESVDVRYAVAENRHIPIAFLEELSDDDNCHVAARSKKTLAQLFPASLKKMPERHAASSSTAASAAH
ncbi:MAG TPA: hypothetical protein V6C69_17690 [Trichormus sp.]|jgi:hypothetical protein